MKTLKTALNLWKKLDLKYSFTICLAMIATVLLTSNLISIKVTAMERAENRVIFSDVQEETHVGQAVAYLKKNGIVNGYGDGTFRPNVAITRSDAARITTATFDHPQNGEELYKEVLENPNTKDFLLDRNHANYFLLRTMGFISEPEESLDEIDFDCIQKLSTAMNLIPTGNNKQNEPVTRGEYAVYLVYAQYTMQFQSEITANNVTVTMSGNATKQEKAEVADALENLSPKMAAAVAGWTIYFDNTLTTNTYSGMKVACVHDVDGLNNFIAKVAYANMLGLIF